MEHREYGTSSNRPAPDPRPRKGPRAGPSLSDGDVDLGAGSKKGGKGRFGMRQGDLTSQTSTALDSCDTHRIDPAAIQLGLGP